MVQSVVTSDQIFREIFRNDAASSYLCLKLSCGTSKPQAALEGQVDQGYIAAGVLVDMDALLGFEPLFQAW